MSSTKRSTERSRLLTGSEPTSQPSYEHTLPTDNLSRISYFPAFPSSGDVKPKTTPSNPSPAPAPRPGLYRATTTTTVTTDGAQQLNATPVLSRPIITRSAASESVARCPSLDHSATAKSAGQRRPSFLRRATDLVQATLDLGLNSNYSHEKGLPTPSHWTDHVHRKALLEIWDGVHAAATGMKYPKSLTAQLVTTEKQMLEEYAELSEGSTLLSREWIEYVLGLNLRHPFCTAERMNRWEVLSASSGARGNWGPW